MIFVTTVGEVTSTAEVGPLDKTETRAYIEHRLRHVGWQDDPHFAPGCFDLIHTLTAGIPRRINTLCNRLLLAGYLAERHALEESDIQAIAYEIHEELGADSALAPMAVVNGPSAAEGALTSKMDATTLHRHFDHLEERIDRLEKTVAAAVDLLHRLLHPDRGAKPSTPARR